MSSRKELANAIRALSMDAVQKAKSGHPGAPMGMADIAEVLWRDFLKHNPQNPSWADRDRFVLSNGHGSMLIYSLLHLTGYDLPMEELKNFRQLHSKTPGHPEETGPTGDQPEAIAALSEGIKSGVPFQTLLGVTGSGKTFTIANVIKEVQRPTLILSHNKTLAAQLYSEFKAFFPNNAVEYFVSYYDYYQPEAYLPSTDTYIEKDLAINEEIDKLRLRATASLLSGRKDVIVVSSVSCLYGMADPTAFAEKVTHLERGMRIDRDKLLRRFVDALYVNNKLEFKSGCFRVNGDTVDIFPAIETFDGMAYRIEFWDDEIDRISSFNPLTGEEYDEQDELNIYPTNLFVTTQERINTAIGQIDVDLGTQVNFLKEIGKPFEAKRLYERVTFDLEMIRELGHCSGIENYSRYFDGRAAGDRPFCLLDYFPKDFMLVVDESHVTIPQIRAMYGGDYALSLIHI